MSDAGRALIIAAVRGITPTLAPGERFTCVDDASGGSLDLDTYADQMRRFQLQTGDVNQGEIASSTPIQWEEEWLLVRTYPAAWGDDREALYRLINSDTRQIIAAIQPPSVWQTGSALSNLHVGHAPTFTTEVPGAGGEVIALQVATPINVEYFATP